MTGLDTARRFWRTGKRVLLDRAEPLSAEDQAAWEDAVALWRQLFEPFAPLIEDADVLELGCGDGRLLAAVARSGGARSAIGLEHRPYWRGEGAGVRWRPARFPEVNLDASRGRLENLKEGATDLILARELDGFLPLEGLEASLERLYAALRPGGEMITRIRCCGPENGMNGPGYGFMTPTAWTMQMLRAGFEIAAVRRIWRDSDGQGLAADWLPNASEEERLTAEIHVHLIRPWESWELDELKPFGVQRRSRRAR